ncbi:hypothetical protein G7Y79_00032g067480 [Physcia stellaris]|nr:hypothetical protein G7Y79_00032g067480 [Physcia stellaris]
MESEDDVFEASKETPFTSIVDGADVRPTPLVKNDPRLVPSRSKATTSVTRADPHVGLEAVTILVRALALRAVVAVLVITLRLSLAPGGIRANTGIVLHLASIFARLGYIRFAVPGASRSVFVRVQLERIFGESGKVGSALWKDTDAGDSRDGGSRRSDRCGSSRTDAGRRRRSDYYRGILVDTVVLAAAFANAGAAAILANVGAPRLIFGALERGGPAGREKAVGDLKDTFGNRHLTRWVVQPVVVEDKVVDTLAVVDLLLVVLDVENLELLLEVLEVLEVDDLLLMLEVVEDRHVELVLEVLGVEDMELALIMVEEEDDELVVPVLGIEEVELVLEVLENTELELVMLEEEDEELVAPALEVEEAKIVLDVSEVGVVRAVLCVLNVDEMGIIELEAAAMLLVGVLEVGDSELEADVLEVSEALLVELEAASVLMVLDVVGAEE